MSHTYYVYILASRPRNLYIDVTNDLQRRMIEHRQGLVPGFTMRCRIFRLVYCEEFGDIREAIAREKEIKAWRREKKLWLINRRNRAWQDLVAPLIETKKQTLTLVRKRSDRVRDDNPSSQASGCECQACPALPTAHLIVNYRSERLGLLRPRPGRFAVIPNADALVAPLRCHPEPGPRLFGGTGVRDLLFRFWL
jgi:putative endonuclease